jgi:hypothetical protein
VALRKFQAKLEGVKSGLGYQGLQGTSGRLIGLVDSEASLHCKNTTQTSPQIRSWGTIHSLRRGYRHPDISPQVVPTLRLRRQRHPGEGALH